MRERHVNTKYVTYMPRSTRNGKHYNLSIRRCKRSSHEQLNGSHCGEPDATPLQKQTTSNHISWKASKEKLLIAGCKHMGTRSSYLHSTHVSFSCSAAKPCCSRFVAQYVRSIGMVSDGYRTSRNGPCIFYSLTFCSACHLRRGRYRPSSDRSRFTS